MSANTITLNGKVYDSKTGSLVNDKHVSKGTTHTHASKPTSHPVGTPHPKKPAHHTAAHKTPHRAQKARTLMRHAVKKPVITAEEAAIVETPAEHSETVALFIPQISESRLKRAEKVHKSKLISRFGDLGEPTLVKRSAHLPVKAHPAETVSHHQTSVVNVAAENDRKDLFSSSLNKAEAHRHTNKQPHHHRHTSKKRPHTALATSAVAIALLGGFFAYQHKPNVEFRVAAARAGVHASLPGYHPAGYAMRGPIEYAPGQLTIHYSSNSDERNFSVTQKVSNWNNQALLNNYVANADKNYQAVEHNGKTIYLYDNGNATWVNNGVWYQVEGASSLSNTQLLKLASSI